MMLKYGIGRLFLKSCKNAGQPFFSRLVFLRCRQIVRLPGIASEFVQLFSRASFKTQLKEGLDFGLFPMTKNVFPNGCMRNSPVYARSGSASC